MKNIIVVDDEPHIVALVAEVLEREGYRVITASGGEEALALMAPEHSWLLILGVSLPDMGGNDLLRRLDATTRLRVIMLHGRWHECGGIQDGRQHFHPDMYLNKPFNPRELVQFVRRIYASLDAEEDQARPRS